MHNLAEEFRKAQGQLSRRDAALRPVMKKVGPCTLQLNPDGFAVLVRSIVSQMISTKAAIAISTRLEGELAPAGLTPAAILAASEAKLRGVGLSGAKVLALHDLSARVQSGLLPLDELARRTDEEVVALLTMVRGIGVWTAEMFLIFSMGRLDVLPVDDLGLRMGVQTTYGLPEMPNRAALRERAEAWRPYRTVATWYMWKSRGFVPQSK
jgi:3-methyladenine DNA glycosylase/8-oxoguanine DNA glycosylase